MVVTDSPSRRKLAAQRGEIARAARADVGDAVGEQHDAVHELAVEMPPHLLRAERHARMNGRAAAGAHAIDARLERVAIALAADALRREQHLGVVVEHDEREVVVIGEVIDRDARPLFRLFEFRALHRAAAVEDDREVHRRAPPVFRAFGVEVDLHDHFARTAGINVIALGRDAQRHIRRSHGRARKDAGHEHEEMDSFHARTLRRNGRAMCQKGVRSL